MAPFGSNKVEPERLQTSLLSPEIILIISINDEQLKLKKCIKEKNFKIKKTLNCLKKYENFSKMTRTVTWQPESGIIVNLAGDGILSVIRDL